MTTIYSPVKGYTGTSAGVDFKNGVGHTSNPASIEWLAEKGYAFDTVVPTAETVPIDDTAAIAGEAIEAEILPEIPAEAEDPQAVPAPQHEDDGHEPIDPQTAAATAEAPAVPDKKKGGK